MQLSIQVIVTGVNVVLRMNVINQPKGGGVLVV